MQPHDPSTSTDPKPPAKSAASRYALALVLMVLIVGAIAWVAQYLPSSAKPKVVAPPPASGKKLVAFTRIFAQWGDKKDDEQKVLSVKDFETGTSGHYDFLFKNITGQEIELVNYSSDCDCTSVKACALPAEEWERINKAHLEKPGEPLAYANDKEPEWLTITADIPRKTADLTTKPSLKMKAEDGGVVRIEWVAKKAAGQPLRLNPQVSFQPAENPSRREKHPLHVPVKMTQPIQFDPPRLNVGEPTTARPATAQFHVWSSTRPQFDVELTQSSPNRLFVFNSKKLSKEECADLERRLVANKIGSHVMSGYLVTATVHLSREEKFLHQGTFYEKWDFKLDGKLDPEAPIHGPEIIGVVKGDVQIGGADDRGKIRFKSFDKQSGASTEVELGTDAKMVLKEFSHKPSFLQVKLTGEAKPSSSGRLVWLLQVTVPANAPGARSFEEEDAVVLQIVGTPERLVRIPLEGHISGQ
jgi:hypothetical protein